MGDELARYQAADWEVMEDADDEFVREGGYAIRRISHSSPLRYRQLIPRVCARPATFGSHVLCNCSGKAHVKQSS